ncbi:hypothetical protein C0966_07475 [Bacillus methanolicus]|nr:hypothetical protein [Bacillus methanolicus]
MKFVFLRPEVCRPLPSDSASPRTPLRQANCYFCLRNSGLAPYRLQPCRAHNKKSRSVHRICFCFFKIHLFFSSSNKG